MKTKHAARSLWEEAKLRVRVLVIGIASFFLWGFLTLMFRKPKDCITTVGRLSAVITRADGTKEDIGLICTKVVTTAGVNYLVDGLQSNTTDVALFRFHASGTGVVAENITDTALGTEVATRVSGSQAEGASANIYRTIATIPYTSTLAITEHGVLSAASAGTLLDRSVFAAINVINGDSIQFTYELTLPAGS